MACGIFNKAFIIQTAFLLKLMGFKLKNELSNVSLRETILNRRTCTFIGVFAILLLKYCIKACIFPDNTASGLIKQREIFIFVFMHMFIFPFDIHFIIE